MRVIFCGNNIQVKTMRSRLKKSVINSGCINCSNPECNVIKSASESRNTDNIFFVAADSTQKKSLTEHGVPEKNIIEYWRFEKTTYYNPVANLFSEKNVDGLIFGMSHSQCAINTEQLTGHYYKVASPSLDLFFHLGFLNYILDNQMVDINGIRSIILELPYYIFNYDLSRFGDFILTKLKYFEVLNNYHHYTDKEMIGKWRIFMSLFDDQPVKVTDSNTSMINKIKRTIKFPLRAYRISSLHDKVWEHVYEETIQENTVFFNVLVEKLRSTFVNAKICILVMPFNPIFRISHKESICNMRSIFYEIVEKQHLQVIDEFDYYRRARYFDDHCHLSKVGGCLYTDHLNQVLKNLN